MHRIHNNRLISAVLFGINTVTYLGLGIAGAFVMGVLGARGSDRVINEADNIMRTSRDVDRSIEATTGLGFDAERGAVGFTVGLIGAGVGMSLFGPRRARIRRGSQGWILAVPLRPGTNVDSVRVTADVYVDGAPAFTVHGNVGPTTWESSFGTALIPVVIPRGTAVDPDKSHAAYVTNYTFESGGQHHAGEIGIARPVSSHVQTI